MEKPDDKHDLLIYDPMPGGSGFWIKCWSDGRNSLRWPRTFLAGCVQECDTACYACLKTFRNQFLPSAPESA